MIQTIQRIRDCRCPALAGPSKAILFAIASRGTCTASCRTIGADCGLAERTVRRTIPRLSDLGWLARTLAATANWGYR